MLEKSLPSSDERIEVSSAVRGSSTNKSSNGKERSSATKSWGWVSQGQKGGYLEKLLIENYNLRLKRGPWSLWKTVHVDFKILFGDVDQVPHLLSLLFYA